MSAVAVALAPTAAPAEEVSPVEKYKFDGFFQTKIAALTCRDPQFVARTDGLIKPEYLESQGEAILVNMALRYFERYKRLPADASIYGTLIREEFTAKTLTKEQALLSGSTLKGLFGMDIADRDYVIEQVATFARHQAVAQAMHQAINSLDKKDFTKIEKVMKDALSVGAHIDYNVYDYDENLDLRLGDRLDRLAGKRPPEGITTGVLALDELLYHKGWGRRELSVIMGAAKRGKSTALIDFGINARAAGHNVLYVTLELAAKIIGDRMDANISEIAMMDLVNSAHTVNDKVRAFLDSLKPNAQGGKTVFKIHEFPAGSFTVRDLRRLIERYKARGIIFDLVIVDYADIMAPERYTDSATENSKNVYVNLRGFAMEENFALLTATQTNRGGATKAVAKMEDVAEDFNKVRIADIIISINATDEEIAAKQARLFFAASRNQQGGFSLKIEQELARMKFLSKVLGVE
jgi:replicative DNA helicase